MWSEATHLYTWVCGNRQLHRQNVKVLATVENPPRYYVQFEDGRKFWVSATYCQKITLYKGE